MKKIIIISILIILFFTIYLNFPKKIIKKKKKANTDICLNIKYCNKEYLSRYKNYKKNNPNLSNEDVITRVNLNLDYSFYTCIYNGL